MAYPAGGRNSNGGAPRFRRDCAARLLCCTDIDTRRSAADTKTLPYSNAGSPPMKRLFHPILLSAVVMSLPAVAQTPPTQGWPANRPPAQPSTTPQVPTQQAPTLAPGTPTPSVPAPGASIVPGTPAPSAPAGQAAAPGAGTPAAVPLPQWFVEIDTAKKGEVTRADFLKYRMKSFEELDANKDAKLSLDEFVKVAEPPFSSDVQGGPNLEERRTRAKAEFQNLDTNRDGFVERGEAEALVHAEFNNYDTDRDNKVTEPEVMASSCRIARPVVDLPQPDSPTRPRVSPSNTSKEIPATACTAERLRP